MACRPPSIVLTIADDQRFDTIRALGYPDLHTPALDRLAERGTAFTHAHHGGSTHGAVCAPSRAMLCTGRGLWHVPRSMAEPWLAGPPGADEAALPLLGEALRRAGYHAHAVGKWHNSKASLARSFDSGAAIFLGGMSDHRAVPVQPFDPSGTFPPERVAPGDGFSTDLFTRAADDFLRSYDGEQPFFLYVAYTAPHDPRTPPAGAAARYNAARLPLPPNCAEQHPFDNGDLDVRDELLAPLPRTPDAMRRHLADYYGMITDLDRGLGQLYATLAETGHAADTVVVHTADHGLAVGQHGLLGKQNLYDHSVRVPLVLAGPDVPQGERCDALCYQHDLHPTLLELAGAAPDAGCEFASLLPLLSGATGRQTVGSAYGPWQRMVRDRRHKLIAYQRAEGRGCDRTQLFDTTADPWETTDLAADPAQAPVRSRLERSLLAWRQAAGDPCLAPKDCP